VRSHARRMGLPVADKPDSADICFVPGGDYRAVVERELGGRGAPGAVVDGRGAIVGRHEGVAGFTVGQRKGLGIALGEKVFVTAIDPAGGEVRVGPREALARGRCEIGAMNWLAPAPRDAAVLVQLRHHHAPEPARVECSGRDDGAVVLHFERPSEAVCPGQYAVLYDGDRVLGGGRIRRESPEAAPEALTAGT
ncbi:MAG TPA: aminomethyltransferase beta-barrel domain-containing protein, partial [Planctomycetota bacterium]|nr:aminomethyltransferase beta-barrel domain-containing protein [Planctomycetota bacterium]